MMRHPEGARLGDRVTVWFQGQMIARATVTGLDPLELAETEMVLRTPVPPAVASTPLDPSLERLQDIAEADSAAYVARLRAMNDEALRGLLGD